MTRKASGQSAAEEAFLATWLALGGPPLMRQHQFARERRFRFDFAFEGTRAKVAIEIDGGVRGKPVVCDQCGHRVRARKADGSLGREIRLGGRHNRAAGFASDCEKLNLAARRGWLVFRFTPQMVRRDPARHILPVIEIVRHAGETDTCFRGSGSQASKGGMAPKRA